MKKFLLFAAVLLLPFAAWAAHQNIEIKVNGMVCDFCAQSVWRVFEDYEAVNDVDINLDTGIVTVSLKDNQTLSDEELNKAIRYAGYELVSVTRHEGNHEE